MASVQPQGWYAGKCDNLSFLRVWLSQMDKVLGGTNGYVPLLEDGNPAPLRKHLCDPQQRVTRQSSLTYRKTDLESSAITKGANQGPDHGTPAEERTML